jgi:hypothetical protein
MRQTQSLVLSTALVVSVFVVFLLLLVGRHPSPMPRLPKPARLWPRSQASPSGTALQEAKQLWGEAQMAVKPELEALAAADPYSTEPEGARRQRLMAQDRGGVLRQAHEVAREAVAQAKSPQEAYQATLWLAIIECDQGHHQEELQHVRRLLVLQPRRAEAWGALRRAAKCNGFWQLSRRADRAVRELSGEGLDEPEDHP